MRDNTAVAATGLLADYLAAHIIAVADFHVAERLAVAAGDRDNMLAKLALALCLRSLRDGSTCLDLSTADQLLPETQDDEQSTPALTWPTLEQWLAALTTSGLVSTADGQGARPLHLDTQRLYLDRYWRAERFVAATLAKRAALPNPISASIAPDTSLNQLQRAAVEAALTHRTAVIVGGPGTGKTHTVAALLVAFAAQPIPPRRIALAAPTGKAAARLEESVSDALGDAPIAVPTAMTVHKLLGAHPARPYAPRHDEQHPLPYDLVILDETSMLSLTMMAQLLAALRDDCRLVLIGDSDQLASVDAGAVLADLVKAKGLIAPDNDATVQLTHNYRFASQTPINDLAQAIRDGDVQAAHHAVTAQPDSVRLVPVANPGSLAELPGLDEALLATASDQIRAGAAGDGLRACFALERHRLLCAHRSGPYGESRWNRLVDQYLATTFHRPRTHDFYAGQPVLVTQNSSAIGPDAQVWNGDAGVVVETGDGLRVAIRRGRSVLHVPPQLLEGLTDLHAMTIHKSQGSQFEQVSILLPPLGSPLLTRELLYTAATRAKSGLVIYGEKAAFEQAIRTPARRASGLADWDALGATRER